MFEVMNCIKYFCRNVSRVIEKSACRIIFGFENSPHFEKKMEEIILFKKEIRHGEA